MTVNLSLGRPLVTLIDEISASALETLHDTAAEWLARLTAVWEDPGSNHTAGGCVYHDSRCDI